MPRTATILLVVPLAMSGCASSEYYMMSEYGSVSSASVKAPCGPYAVFEKGGKLLVRGYLVSEAFCSASTRPVTGAEVRYREAADQYLATKNNPKCRITGGHELTRYHSEFAFTCS